MTWRQGHGLDFQDLPQFAKRTARRENELLIPFFPGPVRPGFFFAPMGSRRGCLFARRCRMTRSQIRLMVDELAEDVRQYIFHTLDNEISIQSEEAGQVAAAIERAFRREMDMLFDNGRSERSHAS
jgi:hypothetical protein